MMLKWPVIALSAAMTLHANACDFDGKNSNIAILANNQGHGFALLERIYTRYDNMLETYDLSSCKKISSGVAKESKVMELLKGKGYYNILENNENERIEYNTSENLSFLFKLAYQNQKYTVSSQALPSGDVQQLNNIKEFLAGKSDAIQPDVVDKIQYKESLESVVYLFQAQNAIGKARPLSMQELKTWINNADSLKNALQNKWVWKNRFENILNPQYLNSLAPAASTINTLESIDEAIQTIQYLNQKQSSNNTSYASFYIEPLAKLVNQGIETVFQQIDPDQINFKDLYQKNQLWISVSSLTKQGKFNITPQLIDLHFKTTLQKQNIETFKKNPEPFLSGNKALSLDNTAFDIRKYADLRVRTDETNSAHEISVYVAGSGSIFANIVLPKKCASVYGNEYSSTNTESDGSIMKSFYKKKTTTCTLSYGVSSRGELEELVKKFALRNQLQIDNPLYQSQNDLLTQSEEVHVRTTQIGVNQQVRAEHNIRQQARQQCRQQQTMCYAQCQGMSDIGDQDYQGFFRGFQSSPKSRCRDTCNNMCN